MFFKDSLDLFAERDGTMVSPIFRFMVFGVVKPNVARFVDVTNPHIGEFGRSHARKPQDCDDVKVIGR